MTNFLLKHSHNECIRSEQFSKCFAKALSKKKFEVDIPNLARMTTSHIKASKDELNKYFETKQRFAVLLRKIIVVGRMSSYRENIEKPGQIAKFTAPVAYHTDLPIQHRGR